MEHVTSLHILLIRFHSLLIAIGLVAVGMVATAGAQATSCQPEPNPTTIEYGQLVECEIGQIGDSDLFRFSGQAGERIVLQVARLRDGDPCVQLTGPGIANPMVACTNRFSAANAARIDSTLPQTGSFSILATERGNDEVTAYRIASSARCRCRRRPSRWCTGRRSRRV